MGLTLKHRVINSTHTLNTDNNVPIQKQWYETIWGLMLLTIGLNVFSNYLYERGRNSILLMNKKRERQKDIDHLVKYEGQTDRQAASQVDQEEKKLDKQQSEGDFN